KSDFHYLRVQVRDTSLQLQAINGSGTILDTFTLQPSPVIEPFKQAPAITFNPGRSAGALIRIMGRNLAAEQKYNSSAALPTTLGGAFVTINDQPIQLIYSSTNELWGRIPFDIPASAVLRVTTKAGSNDIPV